MKKTAQTPMECLSRWGMVVPLWTMAVFLSFFTQAQDLEQIGKKSSFKVSGGISANQVFYYSDGLYSRRDPYNYFISGRLTLSYLGISAPLSFNFSNQRLSYGQPFNILGISPKYKWLTAHLGWRNLSYSPYTLNGHAFLGAGVDVEPIKGWKTSAMYGRMLKAVELNGNNRPSYERYGMGFKTQYAYQQGTVGISMFTAKDDPNSLTRPLDTVSITPQQNVAIGLNFMRKIRHLTLAVDLARSALTYDVRADQSEISAAGVDKVFFLPKKTTTSYYNAYKTALNYQFKGVNVGVGYERIDPGYRTLGAYYFNNDLESINANLSTSLFKNRLSVAGSLGRQRDNLDNSKLSTMKRWVYSGNLSYVPSQKWTFTASYSSFQSITNLRPQIRPLTAYTRYDADTLNFVLLSQSAQGSVTHILRSSETVMSSLMLMGSMQFSSQKSTKETIYSPSFYNGSLAYSHNLPQQKINFSLGVNTNISGEVQNRTVFVGPTLGLGKTFFSDLLRSSLSGSWNTILLNGKTTSSVISMGQSNTITLAKKHNLNATITYLNMAQPTAGDVSGYTRAINEVTATVGYNYSF